MSVTTFTIVALLALVAAWLAYNQGWFTRVQPARKTVNNKAGNGRAIGKRFTK